jgi:hypothetical protein
MSPDELCQVRPIGSYALGLFDSTDAVMRRFDAHWRVCSGAPFGACPQPADKSAHCGAMRVEGVGDTLLSGINEDDRVSTRPLTWESDTEPFAYWYPINAVAAEVVGNADSWRRRHRVSVRD